MTSLENPSLQQLVKDARELFVKEFNAQPTVAAFAPGRVNLIGEHTDYNDGFVLPMALPLVTVVVGRPVDGNIASVTTTDPTVDEPRIAQFSVTQENLKPELPKWANYIKGVVALYPTQVQGFEAAYTSSVPVGGGLSSSAAMEVATYTFLEALTNKPNSSSTEKALICQKAEHEFAGMPCGIMDQFISVMGKEGHALLIDCMDNTSKDIPLNDPNLVILITNSNVKHELSGSEYPTRKKQCADAAKLLKKKSLRFATLDDIQKNLKADPDIIKRARHVISEIKRTQDAAQVLRCKDYRKFGKLMIESHNSLRDDYEVSTPALDKLVEIACEIPGVYGSRMTGGGFGGCTVTLVTKDDVCKVIENVNSKYDKKASFYICVPSNGARWIGCF
ncbi:galactokinase-like isoform X2 [Chrysoperla carnea]|uniref:galactokinase-like isoform X2 n=1 Tax=Chrysoperla carnea TaxID=189513 RepID=UPI001D074758|nr:galactokinase-like isoform X2 [Chrysoperla carnea]